MDNTQNLQELLIAIETAREVVASADSSSDDILNELDKARASVMLQSLHKFRQAKDKFNNLMLDAQKTFTELLHYGELAGIDMAGIERAWTKMNKSRRDSDLMTLLHTISPRSAEVPQAEPEKTKKGKTAEAPDGTTN